MVALSTTSVNATPLPLGILSVERMFADHRPDFSRLPAERLRTLLVTGDTGPGRMINIENVRLNDFQRPFVHVVDVLRSADLSWVNLEGTLVPDCPPTSTGLVFCGNLRYVEGLVYAGVDVASIANNHSFDYGPSGLDSTREALEAAGVRATGNGSYAVVDVAGLRFALLAYDTVISRVDRDVLAADIASARSEADIVVAQFHWGAEYVRVPEPGPGLPSSPRDIGRAAIDAGADLVVGNHPHWVQGAEIYRGRAIVYAHGNFSFDQPWSEETQQGVIGRYTFLDDRLIDIEFVPIRIANWGQPRIAEEPERTAILNAMLEGSLQLEPYVSSG